MKKLLTVDEVAEYLAVKKSTIYQWTHMDFIPHFKLGNKVRFDERELAEWLEKRKVKGRSKRVPEIEL